jgi:hypothetical protein
VTAPPHIMAADNLLTVAGFYLSMLADPDRPASERVALYEAARDAIGGAMGHLASEEKT